MPQFDAISALDALEKYPITVLCCPPTAMRTIVQVDLASRKFASLRHCVSGGEPLNPEVTSKWETETGAPLALFLP
jgi:medium-chain acyl-CoA synthetase